MTRHTPVYPSGAHQASLLLPPIASSPTVIRLAFGLMLMSVFGVMNALAQSNPPFLEQNNVVVMEAESVPVSGNWVIESSEAGHTGSGYVRWNGPNQFNNPGSGAILEFKVRITNPGTYQLRLRMSHLGAPASDQENDCFTRMNGGAWIKTFHPGNRQQDGFTFHSFLEPTHGEFVSPAYELGAGDHTFYISGRSFNARIDRIHMYKSGHGLPDPLSPSLPESPRAGTEPQTRTLTVNSGNGDGTYNVGAVVNINADAPPEGQVFDQWTGDVATVADVLAAQTTITMPDANVTVTATYKDAGAQTRTLTVDSGNGDGTYNVGAVVNINADAPPEGQVFDQWTGDVATVADVLAAQTTITMPDANVTVTATYKAEGGGGLRPPVTPNNPEAGLRYRVFEGTFNNLPDFGTLSPSQTGTTTAIDLSVTPLVDAFALDFTGYIDVPTDGEYTFYTASDDGSRLLIGNYLVVRNDSIQSVQERNGRIALQAGMHPITIEYFEQSGDEALAVYWEGPSIEKATIPPGRLYHEAGGTGGALYGDATLNGEITVQDASDVLKHMAGLETLSQAAQAVSDVSGNGAVSAYDAAMILEYVAELITCFPVEEGCSAAKAPFASVAPAFAWGVAEPDPRGVSVPLTWDRSDPTVRSLELTVPLAAAASVDVLSHLPQGWHVEWRYNGSMLRIVAAGSTPIDAEHLLTLRLSDTQVLPGTTRLLVDERAPSTVHSEAPERFTLEQNYPNPFNPTTEIRYALTEDGRVRLTVYDTLGRRIRTLVDATQTAGRHQVSWDGRDEGGERMASGLYVYRLEMGGVQVSRTMMLLK